MTLPVLVWCVVVPAIVASVSIALARVARGRVGWGESIVVCGWCIAVAGALWGRQSETWLPSPLSFAALWPDEAWQQVIWPLGVASVLVTIGWRCVRNDEASEAERSLDVAVPVDRDDCLTLSNPGHWVIAGIGACLIAMVAMPTGEAWADRLELHRPWMSAIIVASLVNLWMLSRIVHQGNERFVLWISVAGLAGPTMVAGTAYGGLLEWSLAAIVATVVPAIAATFVTRVACWPALVPATWFAVSMTAAGRFYTYEEHPAWLYGSILFTPAIVASVVWCLPRQTLLARVIVAAVVAAALVAWIGWSLMRGGAVEEW